MKILLVDDHPLVREGLRHLLASLEAGVEVLEASEAASAQQLLDAHPDVDLALLDVQLPGKDGLALLGDFGRKYPDLPVVILSGVEDPVLMRRALDSGAVGFIAKTSLRQVIVPALRLVLAGGVYVPPEMLAAPAVPAGGTERPLVLTERQDQVLRLIIEGKSNKEIAAALQLSEPTVKAHAVAVFRVLQVRTRTQAIAAAARYGLSAKRS